MRIIFLKNGGGTPQEKKWHKMYIFSYIADSV